MHKLMSWCTLAAVALSMSATALADDDASSSASSASSSVSSSSSSESSASSVSTSSSGSESNASSVEANPCARLRGAEKMQCVRNQRNARLINKIERAQEKATVKIEKVKAKAERKVEKLEEKLQKRTDVMQCLRLRDRTNRLTCMKKALGSSSSSAGFRSMRYECYDGLSGTEGGDTSCKSSDTWQTYAKNACAGHCSSATGKCGVNSFTVDQDCSAE